MKYTNIKKLLIKFMGGGLINFPTRFLRWIKIDGDAKGDDSGGGSDGGSQEELDFINQAVNIIKNSTDSNFMTISTYDDIKTEIPPEVQKIGDENNADYVFSLFVRNPDTGDGGGILLFLTEDEFNIVWNITIASTKSYLKGYIELNDTNGYDYNNKSSNKYLNFDFVFLLVNDAETLVLDDVYVTSIGGMETDNNDYIKIYVPYTEVNNNFLFKINNSTRRTEFTKHVSIDAEHPVEVNGVNYYPIVYIEKE